MRWFLEASSTFFLEESVPLVGTDSYNQQGDRVTDMWGPKMSPREREKIGQLETTCPKAHDLQSNSSLKVIKSSEEHTLEGDKNGRLVTGLWCPVLVSSRVK